MKKPIKLLIPILIITFLLCFSFINSSLYNDVAYGASDYVYLGGTPIGVVATSNKLIVTDTRAIITKEGARKAEGTQLLQPGDVLVSLDGNTITSVQDIGKVVNESTNDTLKLIVIREDEQLEIIVKPLFDIQTNSRKLGILVKNEIAGIGTLTYVRTDNKRFGGLGHQIFDEYSKGKSHYDSGRLYGADIVGIVKGEAGKAGELRGSFKRGASAYGTVDKNLFSGVFGDAEDILYDQRPLITLGSRTSVQQGKAYIYTTLEGGVPQKFEIEIVKATKQNTASDKSMVIHITDKALLQKTGGICQGMSGSPIIQNGKLIGAVTHVFINDPTRGYGIYIDWMLPN